MFDAWSVGVLRIALSVGCFMVLLLCDCLHAIVLYGLSFLICMIFLLFVFYRLWFV